MPLPRNNGGLPSLDDLSSFNEEFENLETSPEDLEDITDENLDNGYDSQNDYDLEEETFEHIEDDYQEEEIEEEQNLEIIEDLPDPYAIKPSNSIPNEDIKEDSDTKNKISGFFKKDKKEKIKKDKPKKKIKTSKNDNIKKAGMIAGGIIFFIIAIFIVLSILGNTNVGTKTNNKASEATTKSGLSITNRYVQDGTYYMEISSNNDIDIEYIDSAFINDSTLVKCTTFNPYIDKGDNVVEFEDCDYALSDEKVEQYIDNIKLAERKEE